MKNKFFLDQFELDVSRFHSVQDGWFGPVPVIKVFWSPFADQFLGELTQSQFNHADWAVVYAAGLEGQDIYDYEYLWIVRSEHKAVLARYLNLDKNKLFIDFTQNNNEVINA
jgi:hypothetical protein